MSDFPKRAYASLATNWQRGAITVGPKGPHVALTFDDGPDPEWTPKALAALGSRGSKATFFVLGERLEKSRDLAMEIVKEGHELASHLYSHDPTVADDTERFEDELKRTNALIEEIQEASPRFLRFPFAYYGAQRPKEIEVNRGLLTAHWSFSSNDSMYDAEGIRGRVAKLLFPGAIVLLHDGVGANSKYATDRRSTIDALPGLLEECENRGLTPVTMSGMFGL